MGPIIDSNSESNRLDIEDVDMFSRLIIINADENQLKKKKARQISKSDVQKQANLSDEIFNYIHMIYCRMLYILI